VFRRENQVVAGPLVLQKKRRKGKEFCIMKKLIIALVVVLLTAPAWADVAITLSNDNGVVTIGYDSTGEAELVRAFALDITVTGGIITDVTDFVVGDDNGGYGIFPGNFSRYITVDGQTGEVADWGAAGYTPVADVNDPGAAGGLGSNAITIEMGSLYDTQAPAKTGVLCKVVVGDGSEICVTPNVIRGGVVLENAAQATCPEVCLPLATECFPSTNSQYNDWVVLGKPECWCAPPYGSGYQCDGDIDGKDSGFPARFRVFTGDLGILVDNWQKKANDATLDPCADVDHKDSGFPARFRVFTGDLGILVNNWQKKDAALPGDCPR
jgi:hypothetical protein